MPACLHARGGITAVTSKNRQREAGSPPPFSVLQTNLRKALSHLLVALVVLLGCGGGICLETWLGTETVSRETDTRGLQ